MVSETFDSFDDAFIPKILDSLNTLNKRPDPISICCLPSFQPSSKHPTLSTKHSFLILSKNLNAMTDRPRPMFVSSPPVLQTRQFLTGNYSQCSIQPGHSPLPLSRRPSLQRRHQCQHRQHSNITMQSAPHQQQTVDISKTFRPPPRAKRMATFDGPSVWLEFSALARLTSSVNLGKQPQSPLLPRKNVIKAQ